MHYAFYVKYAMVIGGIAGEHRYMSSEEKVALALKVILGIMYPFNKDLDIETYYNFVTTNNLFMNKDFLIKGFVSKGLTEDKALELVETILSRYDLDTEADKNSILVNNLCAHIVLAKFDAEAAAEYLIAVLTNKAK